MSEGGREGGRGGGEGGGVEGGGGGEMEREGGSVGVGVGELMGAKYLGWEGGGVGREGKVRGLWVRREK